MLSHDQCRQVLGPGCQLSDEDLERLRDRLPHNRQLNRNGVLCQSSTVSVALVWLIKSQPQNSDEF
jgi:hypothetical protein